MGLGLVAQAQTTPNVKIDILGIGAESLLGGDLTDANNDGLDDLGGATDSSWDWKGITASHEPDFQGGENSFNIFDNKVGGGNDKWCCDDPTPDAPVWVAVEFKSAVSISHFTVTSGNDTPTRDPRDWAIQGSNDGTTYQNIYRFVDTPPWTERNQVIKFTLPAASPAYKFIRYIAYDTEANLHQINEIEYFGKVGGGSSPLANGLVAYWNFDASNFEDAVGVYDGTANGAAAIPFVNGKSGFGKAISLNGEDQFVEITGGQPDDLAFAGGSVSIAGWFKVGSFDTSWQALVAKGEGNNWRVARRGTENGIAYAGGVTDTPAGKDVNDGNWHHFVAISDHTGANFATAVYIDGVRDTTIEGSANLTANGKGVMIGENPDARSREFEGELDDIAIWGRVLSDAEIAELATKPLSEILGAVQGDTDKDGMPDDWEKSYGFNPNDPSDASKDFDGDGATNLQEFQAGTDPTDVTKPTIVAAATSSTFNSITLTLSEEVDPATVVAGNFTITPTLAISGVSYAKKIVTLTTANQTPGGTAYTVAVKGLKDTSKNEIATGTQVTVFSYLLTKSGVAKISVWEGITGTPVDGLYADERYPASPTRTGTLFSFNSRDYLPTDSLENYGAQMDALVTPTQTGNYRFFIYSDDASQLFLSTDATEGNLAQIAEESGCCNFFTEPDSPRTSEPQALTAGRSYYLRLVYKEGGGGDYGQVAWRREGDATPAGSLTPISGAFLSSPVDLAAPAEGVFLTRTPGVNAVNVAPNQTIRIVHADGKVAWTDANVSLKLDGATVPATITKAGTQVTVTYTPTDLLASESSHTIILTHPNPAGAATTTEWSYKIAKYGGPTRDKVANRPGLLFGTAANTDDKGGRTSAAGDRGMNFGNGTGSINVLDGTFINAAAATDKLSVAFWQKNTVRAGSTFWFNSPSSNNGTRGFQAHVPWSDGTIYFDSAGCCAADTQRINLNIDQYPGYSGDATWWNSWHHYAFVKNGAVKEIYIDGQLFHSGGGDPLPTDFTNLILGGGPGINDNRMAGTIDDFAIYGGALTAAQVDALAKGGAPGGAPNMIAHWDFNEAPATNVRLAVTRSGNNVTIVSDPAALPSGWVLQTAPSITGPWTTQAGATTPVTVPIGAGNAFLRATKP